MLGQTSFDLMLAQTLFSLMLGNGAQAAEHGSWIAGLGAQAGGAVSSIAGLEVGVGGGELVAASALGLATSWFLSVARFPPPCHLRLYLGAGRDMQLPLLHGCLLCLTLSVAGRSELVGYFGSSGS